jgi:5'-nucleotidase
VLDIARDAVKAHMLLATASGFREPIPPGTITEEAFRTAMPYPNRLLVYTMTGAQIQALLDYSVSRSGSDFFTQVSGVRFTIAGGKATAIQVLRDGANPAAGYAALDPATSYSVATSDFQGKVAGGYKEIFAPAPFRDSGIADMRDLVRAYMQAHSPVSAQLDGRIAQASAEQPSPAPLPAELPRTGDAPVPAWWLGVAALLLLALGGASIAAARRAIGSGLHR